VEKMEKITRDNIISLKNKISDVFRFTEKTISTTMKSIKIPEKLEYKCLSDICNLYQPKTITSQEIKSEGKYKVFGANGVIGFYDKYNHEYAEVAITCRGATCGTVNYTEPKSWITGNAMVVSPKDDSVNKKYLLYILGFLDLSDTITGTAQPQITKTTLASFQIPIPPLSEQQKIVVKIEKLEAEIQSLQKQQEEMKSRKAEILRKYL
jgi:restriction endonuclease S subunit